MRSSQTQYVDTLDLHFSPLLSVKSASVHIAYPWPDVLSRNSISASMYTENCTNLVLIFGC